MQNKLSPPVSSNSYLRGFILILLTTTWVAGILLASYLLCSPVILLSGAITSLLFVFILRRNHYGRLFMLLLLCLFCGASRYTFDQPGNDPQAISAFIGSTLSIRGTVSDEPNVSGHSRTFTVDVNSVSRDDGNIWQPAHGLLYIRTTGTTSEDIYGANYGDSIELSGKLSPPSPTNKPGTFASMSFPRIQVESSGGNPLLGLLYNLRVSFATTISRVLPQDAAALLTAIVLGMRTPALNPLESAFNVTGTAHLIAPSGFKVTILAGLIAQSTQKLSSKRGRKRLPNEHRWKRLLSTLFTVFCIACYTVLSGAGAASIRAGIMGSLLVFAPEIKRTYNVYTALALSALLMSLLGPFVLWDVGFQLSFLGTLGIVLLTPYFQRLLRPLDRVPFGYLIKDLIAVTLAAQLATLPINAAAFQNISLVAPLANILTVPLLEILLILGMLLCIFGSLFFPLAVIIGWVAWPLLWYINHAILWCASLPDAYLPITTFTTPLSWLYYLLLTLTIFLLVKRIPPATLPSIHHRPTKTHRKVLHLVQIGIATIIVLLTALSVHAAHPSNVCTIDFLDVGSATHPHQGEAILLRTPDGKTALIDGGLDATSLGQQLDMLLPSWQRTLDTLILTSPRADHITGLLDIVSRYTIGSIFDAGMLHPSTTYARWRRTISKRDVAYHTVVRGQTIPLGSQVSFQVLWPTTHLHSGSNEVRDNGLVLRLTAPGVTLLLLGAAAQSSYALEGLLALSPTTLPQADIIQIMGDTGKTPTTDLAALVQQVHSRLVVVTPAQIQTKKQQISPSRSIPFSPLVVSGPTRILQTQQTGTLEIKSTLAGWHISNTS
jgi:competence protein ComEC